MYKITIIGPGLIGASLGLSLKKNHLAKIVHGVDSNKYNLHEAKKLMQLTQCIETLIDLFLAVISFLSAHLWENFLKYFRT